jgi:hypothetical protein
MKAMLRVTGGAFLRVLLATIIVSAFAALPVKWLWNGVLTDLTKVPEITWMQAWGLRILICLLFRLKVTYS